MLAVVESARSMRSAVQYNEQKVTQEQARLLDAHNFLQEKEELTIRDKLQRFRELTVLNERSRKHCIHFSVNFPPKDELSDRQMKHIAADFMRAIDFGDQPWLVYRHVDVGHPHMHIVTTNIRPDGSRISNDRRSPHFLMQTCFQLEERYGLTPVFAMPDLFGEQQNPAQQQAPAQQQDPAQQQSQAQQQNTLREPRRITYGERPTRTVIAEVLEYVTQAYNFTSFDAYNAALGLYNVRADPGREDSPMRQNKGLYYRLIDERGKKLGAPIKASAFHLPVTTRALEEKIQRSQKPNQELVQKMRLNIDYVLAVRPQPYSLHKFWDDLARRNARLIVPALRQAYPRGWQKRAADLIDTHRPAAEKPVISPDDGHGFFYIDRTLKHVFRDTDLGEQYTAAAVLERSGIQKSIRSMLEENKLQLSNAQKIVLGAGYPDTAETRRLILQLAPHQSQIVQRSLELRREQKLIQRRSRGMRHGL